MKMGIMTNVNQTTENEEKNKDEIVVITKSWWGVINETIFNSFKLILIFWIGVPIGLTLYNNIMLNNKISPIDIMHNSFMAYGSFGICIIILTLVIIDILTTQIIINLKTKEAYYVSLGNKKAIKDIVSIEFNNLPFIENYIIIRDKSANGIKLKMLANKDEIQKMINRFYEVRSC
jgi:hypothetical protein